MTGTVEGSVLINHFKTNPFGWSPDTIRYLVAALFLSGQLKLKVSGKEVTQNGKLAIDALKTNNSFNHVGVGIRHDRPDMQVLATASQRLIELSGENTLPDESSIGKCAQTLYRNYNNNILHLVKNYSTSIFRWKTC